MIAVVRRLCCACTQSNGETRSKCTAALGTTCDVWLWRRQDRKLSPQLARRSWLCWYVFRPFASSLRPSVALFVHRESLDILNCANERRNVTCSLSFSGSALFHYYRPEDIDYAKLKEMADPLQRLAIVFEVGEELGVANILDPEDMMIEPRPDTLSVITYLSQLRR